MGMEQQMGGVSNISNEQMQMSTSEILSIELAIQQSLAGDSDDATNDFIDKHAKAFRDFMNANKYILEKYKKDPEAVLKQVKSAILH